MVRFNRQPDMTWNHLEGIVWVRPAVDMSWGKIQPLRSAISIRSRESWTGKGGEPGLSTSGH